MSILVLVAFLLVFGIVLVFVLGLVLVSAFALVLVMLLALSSFLVPLRLVFVGVGDIVGVVIVGVVIPRSSKVGPSSPLES